jgi:hypothetical protein
LDSLWAAVAATSARRASASSFMFCRPGVADAMSSEMRAVKGDDCISCCVWRCGRGRAFLRCKFPSRGSGRLVGGP